jgi:ribosomal protein S18 acetylase RimI-like enzyme
VTGWNIRDAAPADAGPLARIMGDWLRETGWMPILHSRAEDQAFLAALIGTHRLRIACQGDLALGFLAEREGHIDALYLAPEARGRGIGKALLDEVKEIRHAVELWAYQANSRAIAFYRREGFSEAERTDGAGNEAGLPDIRMTWRKKS